MDESEKILFINGRFIDPSVRSSPLGDSLLCTSGKIAGVGSEGELRAAAGEPPRTVDLGGRTVVPGWVDSHVHLKSLGTVKNHCDLSGTTSKEQALERLAKFAAEHPDDPWIFARGYNLNNWVDPSYPTARDLDAAVPDRCCGVRSFDGHSIWGNTPALKEGGIDGKTSDPEGGRIVRDSNGNPTGMFLESAMQLLTKVTPLETDEQIDRALRAGMEELVSFGITGAHYLDLGGETSGQNVLARFARLFPANTCPLRVRIFVPFDNLQEASALCRSAPEEDRVKVSGIKVFYDGALGARTAYMFDPLTGSDDCGIALIGEDELRSRIHAANKARLPLLAHSIGDRACHEVLRNFAEAGDPRIGNRLEHAQIIRAEDIDLFIIGGVSASMQPSHIWTDWAASEKLLGPERSARSFMLRSLLESGVTLAFGSDGPVVPADPRHSLHAAVTRTDPEGGPKGGWYADQAITPQQWSRAVSIGAWESIGERRKRGTLAEGMDCDLTILREDFMSEQFTDYLGLHIDGAVVGGEITLSRFPLGGD